MKLIKPYYEIITPINGEEILKQIELAARTCYKSEDKIGTYKICSDCKSLTKEGTLIKNGYCSNLLLDRFCTYSNGKYIGVESHYDLIHNVLMKKHHEAMLEFGGNITVKFVVDRGVSHELVRHRIASFAQESTRYCNYGKDEHITFIIPSWFTYIKPVSYRPLKLNETSPAFYNIETDLMLSYTEVDVVELEWLIAMGNAELHYNNMSRFGQSPQKARTVLPNSLKTEINISTNIREWRHIFKLRTAKTAHPQMREVMCPLLDDFKSKIPILFDDINY